MAEDLQAMALTAIASSQAQQDPDYPSYHLAPPVGRLNDPNGLLVDGSTYHAFFQFTPFHPERKLVYWGHATSTDLLTWRHHDPAVAPDSPYDLNGAYSGTALVLADAEVAVAPGRAGYQFFYTGNLKDPQTGERSASQCLVTSQDLQHFNKFPTNPVVPSHAPGYTAHYRDPQVFRDPARPGEYRMLLGVQRANETGAAVFYRSKDLVNWSFEGELRFPDAGDAMDHLGYMWECPNLVRLTDELTGQERDVLIFCPQGIAPEAEGYENIFPCVYAVGRLEGLDFCECDGSFFEVDRGFEFYAPQVFAHRPGEPGPELLMGWAGNATQDDQPSLSSSGWVHTMTVPRLLSLRANKLIQRPVVSSNGPAATACALSGATIGPAWQEIPELTGSRHWQLALNLTLGEQPNLTLRIGTEDCYVDITVAGNVLTVDRSTSRYSQHGGQRRITLPNGASTQLEVLHDASVTELYLGDGALAFTLRSFLPSEAAGVRLCAATGQKLEGLRALRHD
ncbi:Sucrose-6-phosphate hydrolase [Actinomyces bovis]|uniref:beta-fructofuranosidase n=1 Tax=Actinomyces bovis TaxID=1658 RepID=A0ABY1VPF2_9ACTO|nr:glycoside hydrolase family 32 protein [Actinomyces bovis]SPT54003.1 Sucrose-6-phosphate hydrolase [Actinomyces bovis]VEG53876.1 Sucrose-6-phosphate hydrolase [Actinomyces israelii]